MVLQVQNIELSEAEWIENESINRLLLSRRGTLAFAALATCVLATQLVGHVNTALVFGWLAASLLLLYYRFTVKTKLTHFFRNATVSDKSIFLEKYSFIWSLNAFIWGLASWLFLATVPLQNQYVCATILNGVGFVAVLSLNSQRRIAGRYINILMGTHVLASLWQIVAVSNFDSPFIQYVHLLSLILVWLFLHLLDNKNYAAYKSNLILLYRNNRLIHSLNRKTEQLASEKKVVMNANQVIQRFYSSAAHDIRQPVYALKIYAELAMQDETKVAELLPKMNDSCNAIEALFASLFDFEKIKSGLINVVHETVDIETLLLELKEKFEPPANKKNIEFRVNGKQGFLYTDRALVLRILTCFLSNAVKYTRKGGVLLSVRKTAASLDFEVWDTGCGIAKKHHERVFEEFYKVGEHSSADEGFGLGLCVVRRLSAFIENSTISLRSSLGRGSVFKFSLPISVYTPANALDTMGNDVGMPQIQVMDMDIDIDIGKSYDIDIDIDIDAISHPDWTKMQPRVMTLDFDVS
jgi:signal transduction histidine kinase